MAFIPTEDRLSVPYLCEDYKECNENNFEEYPLHHGFDIDRLVARGDDHSDEELEDVAAFLQAWLYFGLMRKVLGPSDISLQLDDFIDIRKSGPSDNVEGQHGNKADSVEVYDDSEDDSFDGCQDGINSGEQQLTVDTIRLPIYVLYWIAKETHTHDIERRERLWMQHATTFSQTILVVNKLIAWRSAFYPLKGVDADEAPMLDSVVLSIVLLSEYVLDTCKRLFADEVWKVEWELDNALRWRLLRAGWCPGEITVLQHKMIYSTSLYIVSTFDRHHLTKDHTPCSEAACLTNDLDESIYETKHASKACNCAHIGDEIRTSASIANFLRSGSVPVFRVSSATTGPKGDLVISVKRPTRAPYVAISHVWFDGLGNPRNNTLPQCQLRRLQSYVDSLYPEHLRPVAWWIDSICVPRQANLRRIAIGLLAQTYKAADKVLVIDEWLMQTKFGGISSSELLRLKSCTWSQRLWTLHECMLTRTDQLYVQTLEGAMSERQIYRGVDSYRPGVIFMANLIGSEVDSLQTSNPDLAITMTRAVEREQDIDANVAAAPPPWDYSDTTVAPDREFPWREDWKMLNSVNSWFVQDFVWIEGRDHFLEMRWPGAGIPNDIPLLEANAVLIIGESMRFRSTSWIEDEPICFATLLGQDLKDILAEKSVQERMKVVVSRMKHVPARILFLTTPRIDEDGFRWAPLSFRAGTGGKAYSPGVCFTTIAEVRPEGLLARLDGIVLESYGCCKVGLDFLVSIGSELLPARLRGQTTYAGGEDGKALALMVWSSLTLLPYQQSDAVMVEIQRTEGEIIFARLLAHYFLGPSKDGQPGAAQIIPGRAVQQRQWCVG